MDGIPTVNYLCDFNDVEDDKTLAVLLPKRTPAPASGDEIGLVDADGNRATGNVFSSSHRIAMVEVDWLTWDPAPGFVDSFGDDGDSK